MISFWLTAGPNFRELFSVQPPENRSGPCEDSSEYYPKDEKGVENKNKTCQSGIQGDGEDNREHDSSLVPIFYAARSLTSAEVADRAQCAQQKKCPLTSTPWPITL